MRDLGQRLPKLILIFTLPILAQPLIMSAQTSMQPQVTQAKGPRGTSRRGGNRGRSSNRGRGGRNVTKADGPATFTDSTVAEAGEALKEEENSGEEMPVCWICAEPVKYYSVPECNHRTCHVCSLRLRALYKKTDCTFCKVSAWIIDGTSQG